MGTRRIHYWDTIRENKRRIEDLEERLEKAEERLRRLDKCVEVLVEKAERWEI